ncbi:MAG: transcriptional regulator [Betaproteobacteria bacterium RIFCSPLOWO2_12_FULL_62_58]|nr:MAG: transcriptional regulator [Betaproteobacteria bacterium RIFCSPLOWO2_02_FULL_62_79]OGA50512.1 MAG: transcriptional regulator [Betaproteobacteria bacterium RIFCSPLOWO2_12_FULL_62_58]
METKAAVRALGALAQESRLKIYRLLVRAGPEGIAAGTIAEKLGLPPATLSFHLKELNHAGLVTSRQEGRFVIYSANFESMLKLVGFLTENCCGGNVCGPELLPPVQVKKGAIP